MIREVVFDQSPAPAARAALRKRLISGLGVGGFGLLVVSLGGWWFTAALGGMAVSYTHLTLPTTPYV